MVAPMASTPKEKDKCLEKGDKEEKAAETPENREKMTCKKFIKLLFGFFVFISLIMSYTSIFSSVRSALARTSDCAAEKYAGAILVVVITVTLIYCYLRDAYTALSTEISTQMAVLFSPYSEKKWHYAIAKSSAIGLHYLCLGLTAQMLKWSLATLIYGPEISSNLLKNTVEIEELTNTTFNETEWGKNLTLSRSFYMKCIGGWPVLLLFITMNLIVAALQKAANGKLAKQAKMAMRFISKVCGSEFIEIYWHMLCFQIFSLNIDIFPVLSGWITNDCLESFNIFSSFFLVLLPIYIIFFLSCAILELLVYWMHKGRKQSIDAKPDHFQPLSPSIA